MKFLKRKVYFELKNHLSEPEISLILGPRQAGKTTLMFKLMKSLNQKNKAHVYFNLDVIEDRQHFTSQHALLDQIRKKAGDSQPVVFIDEVQRLENAGLFLKGLYDLQTNLKFVVSGSGSLELKANIIEPMTGRKKIFYCLPLFFIEFAANKIKSKFNNVEKMLESNPFEKERLVKEYLLYGGYPRVILAKTHSQKLAILSEIYKSYLEKDIQLILGVKKDQGFQFLVKILASQIGNLINRAELASTCGINEKTVEKYLNLLEKTFVIKLVRPFYTNIRKELRKSPKVYFLDLGFLSLARGRLQSSILEGGVFENACYLRLLEKELFQPIRFWRTVSGAEVDFVFSPLKTKKIIGIEAKLSVGNLQTLGKSLISFIKNYKPKNIYIYNKDKKAVLEKLGTRIYYIPYYCLPDF